MRWILRIRAGNLYRHGNQRRRANIKHRTIIKKVTAFILSRHLFLLSHSVIKLYG